MIQSAKSNQRSTSKPAQHLCGSHSRNAASGTTTLSETATILTNPPLQKEDAMGKTFYTHEKFLHGHKITTVANSEQDTPV
jgi:hypothetical protein